MRSFFTTALALSPLLLASVRALAPEAAPPHAAAVVDAEVHRHPRSDLRMSNAKRLALGRPLRRPKKVRDAQILGHAELGKDAGRQPSANAGPVADVPNCINGFVRISDPNDNELGFIAAPLDGSGLFNELVTSLNDPNILTVCRYPLDQASGTADVLDTGNTGNSTVPYFGAIVAPGYNNDLSGGVGDFVYLGLVAQTPPTSPPVPDQDSTGTSYNEATGAMQRYESNFWYTSGTGVATPVWRDTNSGTKILHLARLSSTGEFIASESLSDLGTAGIPAKAIQLQFYTPNP